MNMNKLICAILKFHFLANIKLNPMCSLIFNFSLGEAVSRVPPTHD